MTDEDIDRSFDVNVRGYMIAARAALKHLKPGGRIVNVGSIVGERMPFQNLVVYAATKGAVRMFTQALARELGPRGITVNAVAPGPIDTEANPAAGPAAAEQIMATSLGRYGRADEVSPLVAYLASAESGYSTGSTFTVDGGVNA
jgi:3-oxoacyl-[acyl-carrier protein] reductase